MADAFNRSRFEHDRITPDGSVRSERVFEPHMLRLKSEHFLPQDAPKWTWSNVIPLGDQTRWSVLAVTPQVRET